MNVRVTPCAWLISVGVVCHLAAAAPNDHPPNIVLILADDLGYGDVHCYNPQSKIETPHLDQLAAEGLRFTDAHAGGTYCVPSRYALLTGCFSPRMQRNPSQGPVIEKVQPTIASFAKDHGYRTALVGKWHLGFEGETNDGGWTTSFDHTRPFRGGPVDHGFDQFFGMHSSLDIPPYFYIRDRCAVLAPVERVAAHSSMDGTDGWNEIQGEFWRAGDSSTDFRHADVTQRFVEEAIRWIDQHAAAPKAAPLFLYLALPSPHTPWLPNAEFRGKSGAGTYGDFVMQVDAAVGAVMAAVSAHGMGGHVP